MSKKRRAFSAEYKREAVRLVAEQGYSIAQACACLGVGETAMRRWLAQVESESKGYVLPGSKSLSPELQRIRELEARVKELELEKHILKKATAILMSDELNASS